MTSCAPKEHSHETIFTRADSLTDRYLDLQDSVLFAWNTMINDETAKLRSMHQLIELLLASGSPSGTELTELQARLEHLMNISLTPGSLENEALIEEYDFTNALLVSELVSIAENEMSSANRLDVKVMVGKILSADQQAADNRAFYDQMAVRYNKFLKKHKALVREMNGSLSSSEKPVFEVVAE